VTRARPGLQAVTGSRRRFAKLVGMSQHHTVPTFTRSLTQTALMLLCATALGIAACGGGGGGGSGNDTIGNERPLDSSQAASTTGQATVLGAPLNAPWGLAFLPDGRMLVTEKGGSMAIVSSDGARVDARVSGLPGSIDTNGQGGLLDVVYDGGSVYFTFAELGTGGSGTALARAELNGNALQNVTVIWRQAPKVGGGIHYGSRIAFAADGTLYVTAGERGVEANNGAARSDASGVQNADNTIGKVVRMNRDGSNASVFSTGHRNPQGAAVAPGSNDLWITEHGPQGGDELNRVVAGANYGWPIKSYGCEYNVPVGDSCRIGGGTHAPAYTEPKAIWVPTSTAPSGLMFYNGAAFPEWQGSVFSGALAGATLWRMTLDGNGNAVSRQEVAAVKALGVRIRDVRQGPDGNIYLLTNGDSGVNANRIVRLAP
jgi:aldose sugar dehydrogenase